jgi:S-adenosylmethionine hydrolase
MAILFYYELCLMFLTLVIVNFAPNIHQKSKVGIITLTTDKGYSSPEVSIMKFQLELLIKNVKVVDLYHEIEPFDFKQAALVLDYLIDEFPAKSIHIVLVDTAYSNHKRWLVKEFKNSYILSADNGLLPILEADNFENIKAPIIEDFNFSPFHDLSLVAHKLIIDHHFYESLPLAESVIAYHIQPLSYIDDVLKGEIIYIERHGNLVTNISHEIFEKYRNGRKYRIVVTRHDKHTTLQKNYSDVGHTDMVCKFNRLGRLEIALNRENASQLLGLKIGKPVIVEFY